MSIKSMPEPETAPVGPTTIADAVANMLSMNGIKATANGATVVIDAPPNGFLLTVTDGTTPPTFAPGDPLADFTVGTICTRRDLGRASTDMNTACRRRIADPSTTPAGFECSRPAGHPGQHLGWVLGSGSPVDLDAYGEIRTVAPGDAPTSASTFAPAPVDPLAHVREGDRLTAEEGKFVPDDCERRCTSSRHGYTCCRPDGHTGPHVATFDFGEDAEVCCDPWPNENDVPATTTTTTAPADDEARIAALADYQSVPSDLMHHFPPHDKCGAWTWDESRRCTRAKGHAGLHVATGGGRTKILACAPYDGSKPKVNPDTCSPGDPDPTKGPNEANPCNYDLLGGDYCSRPYMHLGQHVSGNGVRVKDVGEATV